VQGATRQPGKSKDGELWEDIEKALADVENVRSEQAEVKKAEQEVKKAEAAAERKRKREEQQEAAQAAEDEKEAKAEARRAAAAARTAASAEAKAQAREAEEKRLAGDAKKLETERQQAESKGGLQSATRAYEDQVTALGPMLREEGIEPPKLDEQDTLHDVERKSRTLADQVRRVTVRTRARLLSAPPSGHRSYGRPSLRSPLLRGDVRAPSRGRRRKRQRPTPLSESGMQRPGGSWRLRRRSCGTSLSGAEALFGRQDT
jgi:hypothetical protein